MSEKKIRIIAVKHETIDIKLAVLAFIALARQLEAEEAARGRQKSEANGA